MMDILHRFKNNFMHLIIFLKIVQMKKFINKLVSKWFIMLLMALEKHICLCPTGTDKTYIMLGDKEK
jgi:hypothetical protein